MKLRDAPLGRGAIVMALPTLVRSTLFSGTRKGPAELGSTFGTHCSGAALHVPSDWQLTVALVPATGLLVAPLHAREHCSPGRDAEQPPDGPSQDRSITTLS